MSLLCCPSPRGVGGAAPGGVCAGCCAGVIQLRGLRMSAVVGVLPSERATPQPLEADVSLELCLCAAGAADSLDGGPAGEGASVDYAALAAALAAHAAAARALTIEALASQLAHRCLRAGAGVRAATVSRRAARTARTARAQPPRARLSTSLLFLRLPLHRCSSPSRRRCRISALRPPCLCALAAAASSSEEELARWRPRRRTWWLARPLPRRHRRQPHGRQLPQQRHRMPPLMPCVRRSQLAHLHPMLSSLRLRRCSRRRSRRQRRCCR